MGWCEILSGSQMMSNVAMKNPPFFEYVPIKPSIDRGFSGARVDYQRVPLILPINGSCNINPLDVQQTGGKISERPLDSIVA